MRLAITILCVSQFLHLRHDQQFRVRNQVNARIEDQPDSGWLVIYSGVTCFPNVGCVPNSPRVCLASDGFTPCTVY